MGGVFVRFYRPDASFLSFAPQMSFDVCGANALEVKITLRLSWLVILILVIEVAFA